MTVTKPEIKASAIYKVTIKESGKECYAVPSDSHPGMFYRTCWDAEASSWTCTCKHGEIAKQYGKEAHCKHTRAAQVSVLANKANRRRAREDEANMVELKAEMEQRVEQKFDHTCLHCRAHYPHTDEEHRSAIAAERRQHAPLNGGGRAFSLLK